MKSTNKPDGKNTGSRSIGKDNILWIGTSLSKALDKDEFDKDDNLNINRTYCIKEEAIARFKKTNCKAVVPEVIDRYEPDILVLQTGSIEITNIDVAKAIMDN